ncbi:MAG TPA: hypothetical protein PLN33_20640 [Hyphomonadaceae bacterium]|nr:hypothetical protein [Hyphomonadaceae bacterium]
MRSWLGRYLRFAGFSVAALAVAACVEIAPAHAETHPEPLVGDPPESGQMAVKAETLSEIDRITALEAQVAALDSQVAHLRKALDVLGPLPEHPELFIPVSKSEITGQPANSEAEANVRLAALYSPAPALDRASSLFYAAELGSFASKTAAENRWKQLVVAKSLTGLEPGYAAVGAETRLTAGGMTSEAAVEALCVELSSLTGACRAVAPIRAS